MTDPLRSEKDLARGARPADHGDRHDQL